MSAYKILDLTLPACPKNHPWARFFHELQPKLERLAAKLAVTDEANKELAWTDFKAREQRAWETAELSEEEKKKDPVPRRLRACSFNETNTVLINSFARQENIHVGPAPAAETGDTEAPVAGPSKPISRGRFAPWGDYPQSVKDCHLEFVDKMYRKMAAKVMVLFGEDNQDGYRARWSDRFDVAWLWTEEFQDVKMWVIYTDHSKEHIERLVFPARHPEYFLRATNETAVGSAKVQDQIFRAASLASGMDETRSDNERGHTHWKQLEQTGQRTIRKAKRSAPDQADAVVKPKKAKSSGAKESPLEMNSELGYRDVIIESPAACKPSTARVRLLTSSALQPTSPWITPAPTCTRCFSSSATLFAKGKNAKGSKKNAQEAPSSRKQSEDDEADTQGRRSKPEVPAEDPFVLDETEEAYARVAARGEDKLKAIRMGSRFTPEVLGKVPVTLSKKAGGKTVPLEETALVDVRQGRMVQLTLFEAENRKAVISAIQASDQFNQQPQQDPEDPTILTLKVEPEKLEDQLRNAKDVAHAWREGLRKVTNARQKKHSQWKDGKIITRDDKTKLDKVVQKMQDIRMKAVDAAEERAVQALKKARSNTLDF
ncbi:hypothetical protein PspLS_04197 [Pyricularia sp. CBS 133598]|nr:hypothetical protein PspLS_04197 [Pyricularia sp. CBS 133598]